VITSPSAVFACPPTGNTHTAANGSGCDDGKALRALLSRIVERDGGSDALERVLRPF